MCRFTAFLFYIFFLMIRRPPRSTLFPYNDALPISLAQLLSHQAGLAALDQKVDVLDYEAVIDALETQEPNWPPGTAHGYHARTFGFLLDELVRSEEHTSELQSQSNIVCRLLLDQKQ